MSNSSISIITPSVRHEGLSLVKKALAQQGLQYFEWIIGSPEMPPVEIMEDPVGQGIFWVKDPPKNKGDVWTLNKSYNAMLRKARGDLIVSWQDWTYAKLDTLQMFWQHFLDEPKTLVSAVGNKYEDETWSIMTWKDPRIRDDMGSYYSCYFPDIEGNLASVPREAFYRVGGADEAMDVRYGMDFYNIVHRLAKTEEYDFKLDQSIKSYSLEHGRLNGKKWDELNWLTNGRYDEYARTQPIKLDYLREKNSD